MTKEKAIVAVEISPRHLKTAVLDVSSMKLLSASVKDISFFKTKEETRFFIINNLREAIPPDISKHGSRQ